MDQLHKRFTDEQVKVLFQLYCQGLLTRADVQEMLHIGKSRLRYCQMLWIGASRAAYPNGVLVHKQPSGTPTWCIWA